MTNEFPVRSSAKGAGAKAAWAAPLLSEYGNLEKLTLGSGPGRADMGMGNFGHHSHDKIESVGS